MGLAAARAADRRSDVGQSPDRRPGPDSLRGRGGRARGWPDSGRDYLVVPTGGRRSGLRSRARAGDTVVLAGKGHEDYQIVGDERRTFSDREEALAALAKSGAAAAGDTTRGERVWHSMTAELPERDTGF